MGLSQLVLQSSQALAICSRPSSGETQNRTGSTVTSLLGTSQRAILG